MKNTNKLYEQIARDHLRIPTLEIRRSDRLDFHTVGVWEVTAALGAAFDAGHAKAQENADINELLAARNQIGVIWDVEDVQSVRPDLNDQEAFQVLREAKRGHDANWGINWQCLEIVAQSLFGEAPDPDEADLTQRCGR